jgi:hypothetical protein
MPTFKKGTLTMPSNIFASVKTLALVLLGALLFAGCATSGHERASRTTSSMNVAQPELEKMKSQVGITLGTLNSLFHQKNQDPRPQYEQFSKELKEMENQAKVAYQSVRQTKKNGDTYFEAWGKDLELFSNPDIRMRSADRREKAMQRFGQINTSMEATDEAFYPLLIDLQDVEKYLSHDLTPEGIGSIKDILGKANQDAKLVTTRIDATIAELQEVEHAMEINKNMTSSTTTSAKPGTTKPSNL